jgi:hypothetical protein
MFNKTPRKSDTCHKHALETSVLTLTDTALTGALAIADLSN